LDFLAADRSIELPQSLPEGGRLLALHRGRDDQRRQGGRRERVG